MQPLVQKGIRIIEDYSFPWSMVEEGKAPIRDQAFDLTAADRRINEDSEAGNALPIAFRAWLLEHGDELVRH